ncbi:MAG: hypothetical protein ACFE8A_08695 [Candidatus Hodarchaeota archaeon]
MSIFIFILNIITIIVITLVISFRKRYKKHLLKDEEEESASPLDKLLDKFIYDENKEFMKEKFAQVSEIVAETQNEIDQKVKKKVKAAEAHYKFKRKELRLIIKAGKQYDAFMAKLKSAMPTTEKERQQDMKELKAAISILESYDEESYIVGPKKTDAASGIFYDKMSRQFKSIIIEQNLNNYVLIPIQRLKYHAFQNIKNLKDTDVLPILNIMKETKMLNDIIEISSPFYVIVFSEEKLTLSLSEKVFLSFAYNEDLTLQKLLELTEWKEEHAKNVIKRLSEKGLITIFDNKIIVGGFGQLKDRKKWNDAIEESIQDEKVKELEKQKRQLERKQQLKQKLTKVEELKLSKTKPKAKKISKKQKLKETQEIKDKDALVGAMEALDDIMPTASATTSEIDTKDLKIKEASLEELISENILKYHEKFSIITGGLVQYEKIKNYIILELEAVPDDLLKVVLNQLIEFQMIDKLIKIGKFEFYLFNEISLSDSEKDFIKFAINKNPMKKEEFIKGLNWDEQKTLFTMKGLQKKGILILAKHNVIIPGIIQIK